MSDLGVHVTAVRPRGRQQLSCGHVVDVGDRLYDLATAASSVSLCGPCFVALGQTATDLAAPKVHGEYGPGPGQPGWIDGARASNSGPNSLVPMGTMPTERPDADHASRHA